MKPSRRLLAFAVSALMLATTACAPSAFWMFANGGSARPHDCNSAVSRVWPGSLQGKAKRIVWRESRNRATAQNRRSSAAGCFQLLSMHSRRFTKLGFSWRTDRYDPVANTLVAYDLYRDAGWSPWA